VEQLYRKLEKYAIAAEELVTRLQSGTILDGEKARNNLDSQEVLLRSIADAAKELSTAEASAMSRRWGCVRDWGIQLARQNKTINDHLDEHEVQNPPMLSSDFTLGSNASRTSRRSAPSLRKRGRDSFSSKHSKSKITRNKAQSNVTSFLDRLVLPRVCKRYRAATDRSMKRKDEREIITRSFHLLIARGHRSNRNA
jgi:hypothetical protein